MDQNKEKIRYILQYHFDQSDNASQSSEKMKMYENQQHANGSLAFLLEILMSKTSPVLVGQFPKKVMKL